MAYWSEEDAGLVEDPTLVGVDPATFMNHIKRACLTEGMMWNFRDAQEFNAKLKEFLAVNYRMFSPKVFGSIESAINTMSFCPDTFVGKYATSQTHDALTNLCNKYGFLVIQLHEGSKPFNYIWFPYTPAMEGRSNYISTFHDHEVLSKIETELVAKVIKRMRPTYATMRDLLIEHMRGILIKPC